MIKNGFTPQFWWTVFDFNIWYECIWCSNLWAAWKSETQVWKPDIQDRRSLHMVIFTASILLYLLIFTYITSLVFLLLLFTFLQTEKSWRNLMTSIYCMLFNQTFLETTRRLHLNESWSINNPSLVMYWWVTKMTMVSKLNVEIWCT